LVAQPAQVLKPIREFRVDSLEVSAEAFYGYWAIRGRVGGVDKRLLISLSATESLVDPAGIDEAGSPPLVIRGFPALDLGKVGFKRLPLPQFEGRADGILGLDALRGVSVGFDQVAGTVSFWRGSPAAEERMRWFRARVQWPNESQSVSVKEITITDALSPALAVNGRIGASRGPLLIASSLAGSAVEASSASEVKEADFGFGISKAFGADGAERPVALVQLVKGLNLPGSSRRPLGRLGLDGLPGRQIIFDLPSRKIYVLSASQGALIEATVSQVAGIPIHRLLGLPILGPRDRSIPLGDDVDKFGDYEIYSYGPILGSHLAHRMGNADRAVDLIADILSLRRKTVYVSPVGKVGMATISVPPLGGR
jgi:hypothetical protein